MKKKISIWQCQIHKNSDFLRSVTLSSLRMMPYAYFSTSLNVFNSASKLTTETELYTISYLKLVGRLLFHSNMANLNCITLRTFNMRAILKMYLTMHDNATKHRLMFYGNLQKSFILHN